MTLTAERARELLDYDPVTGVLRKRSRINGSWRQVTTINKDGYLCVKLDQKVYIAHRVIFLIMTGRWPHPTIDHLSRCRTDNRWANLREATAKENHANRGPSKRSEHPGAFKMLNTGRYEARASINRRTVKLGTYDTPEEAVAAIQRRRAGMLL